MGNKVQTYAVRIKTKGGPRTVFISGKDHKKVASRVKHKGQILSVKKVSHNVDELFSIDLLKLIAGDQKTKIF